MQHKYMNRKVIISLVILAVVGAGLYIAGKGAPGTNTDTNISPSVATGDPLEATLTFYQEYLAIAQDPSVDPIASSLVQDSRLSKQVQSYIKEARSNGVTVDPVLCQSEIPEKVRAKEIFASDTQAKVQVLGRGSTGKSPEQAMVTLAVVDGQWQIQEIACLLGESAPEREFTFDREGFLLKSVPPPLNPDYWHLVFEENGEKGHTAPLFFDGNSTCIALDGTESVCDESTFTDATRARVQGNMTEVGVEVVRVTFLPKE